MIAALLALALAQAAAPQAAASPAVASQAAASIGPEREASPPIAREWRVRRQALLPAEAADEIRAELASPSWREREGALDALARGAPASWTALPDARAAARAALSDPHPSVRAAALHALASAGAPELLSEADVERLAGDELPAVRAALVRAWSRLELDQSFETLERLTSDPDRAVACAARAALLTHGVGLPPGSARPGAAHAARVFGLLFSTAERADLVEAAGWLASAGTAPEVVAAGRAAARARADPLRARDRLALVEALAFTLHGTGDAVALLDGWIGEGPWEPERTRLLAAGLDACGDGTLALSALAALAREGAAVPVQWRGLVGDARRLAAESAASGAPDYARSRAKSQLAEGVARLLGAAALAQPTFAALDSESATLLLAACAPACAPAALGPFLDPARPVEQRRCVVHALARAAAAPDEHGAQARALLASVLDDPAPDVAARAFRALVAAAGDERTLAALASHWRKRAPPARAELAADLPRGIALAPLRADFLELGAHGGRERAIAAELLGAFAGDAEVADTLARWLAEELAGGERARAPEGTGDGAARAHGLVAVDVLRALVSVGEDGAVPLLADTLARTAAGSELVAKTAARLLGERAAGRDVLGAWLAPAAPRRIRVEASIWIARRGPAGSVPLAVARLAEDWAGCSWELRLRMLEALVESGDPAALRFAGDVPFDSASGAEVRTAAVSALAALSSEPWVLAALERAARAGPEPDLRLAAVRALGRIGGAASEGALARFAGELAAPTGSGWVAELGPGEAEWLATEVLLARAATGALPRSLERALLAAPLASAEHDLEQRFRGAPPAATGSVWRAELDLARHLAAQGRLGGALEGLPYWCLDARLLASLAERAALGAEPEVERALARAALVALAGEREPDQALELGLRSRLLSAAEAAQDWDEVALHAAELVQRWASEGAGRTRVVALLGGTGIRGLFATLSRARIEREERPR